MTHIFLPGPDNTGAGWVKVFHAVSASGSRALTREVDPVYQQQWSLRQVTARNVTGFVTGMRWGVAQHRKTKPAILRPLPLPYPFQDKQQIGIVLIHLPYRK